MLLLPVQRPGDLHFQFPRGLTDQALAGEALQAQLYFQFPRGLTSTFRRPDLSP